MYKVTAHFKTHKVTKAFLDIYEAIEFRDTADANYPLSVTFEKGKNPVKSFIISGWYNVMDNRYNPLRNIPDLNTRHMVMQVLAWMWCIVFSMYFSSMWMFGITAVAHVVIIAAIAVTVGTFEMARRNPTVFKLRPGFHSAARSRQVMYLSGKNGKLEKIQLDPNDPGGEHE